MSADTLSLAGKVAIVTGSGRENGIGAAIATALGRNGALVAVNYVSDSVRPRAEAVAANIASLSGTKAIAIQADVSTPSGAEKLVRKTLAGLGVDHIDILINNAGGGASQGTLLLDLTPDQISAGFGLNTFSSIYTAQAAVPHMRPGSRIVNIGSVVSRMTATKGVSLYGATKAAQEYLTHAMAAEFGPSRGITVNTVAPGPVFTDAVTWFPEGELRDEVVKDFQAASRVLAENVFGKPDDVAGVVLMVVSERAAWVTGQYISVSGGIAA